MMNIMRPILQICLSPYKRTSMTNKMSIRQAKYFNSSVVETERIARVAHGFRSTTASVLCHHYNDLGSKRIAQNFIREFPEIKNLEKSDLDKCLTALRWHGYTWPEVRDYREVLLLTPSQLQGRITLLQDLSIPHPLLHHVLLINRYLEFPIAKLRELCIYTPDTEVFGSLLTQAMKDLQLPQEVVEDFCRVYQGHDTATPIELYMYLLKQYLALRFNRGMSEIEECLAPNFYPCRSLREYVKICNLLIDSMGLDFSEVRERQSLLAIDPENAARILERCPSIGGTPIIDIIRCFPKLLFIPYPDVLARIELLEGYQVTDFTFTKHTLFMLSSRKLSRIEMRLRSLSRLPEWEVIKMSQMLFPLLVHKDSIQRLLAISQSGQVIYNLATVMKQGDEVVKRKLNWVPSPELVTYLSHELDISAGDTKNLLSDGFHLPYGIANAKKVLRLLFDFGFTREQIMIGMMTLCLESGIVDQALKSFPHHPSAQPFTKWMDNPFILHLLGYIIKKDFLHPDASFRKRNREE
ncbi:hypothetical protein Pcinc_020496 [Petrolisthes cinctipes]|uniref:Uncharacterized protein n=1 Tax=Petrolisthes cinctipes TaxID=88211 RepID=A0AAE1KJW1_PETCI|nr:hypothetical protein Pcinc_020496 [Petrolisthes cinctipes]